MKFKRIAALLLCLTVYTCMLSGCALKEIVQRYTDPTAFDWQAVTFTERGYQSLTTETERKFYAYFDRYVHSDTPEQFRFDYTENIAVFAKVSDIYLLDHPEVFWVNGNNTLEVYSYGEDYMLITVAYTAEGETLQQMKQALETAVAEVLATVPADSSDYEKELLFNDWLVDHADYNTEAAESTENVLGNEHNAYGAMVEHSCVCDGYAAAFKLLCDRVGIENSIILGTAETDGAVNFHAWNAVQLDGEWYQTDVTWNEAAEATAEGIGRYLNFNLTTEQIQLTHTVMPLYDAEGEVDLTQPYNAFVPECTATEYNYFLHTFPTFDDVESEAFAEALAEQAAKGADYFVCNLPENADYDEVYNALQQGIAARQMQKANEINAGGVQLTPQSYIMRDDTNRVVILKLSYN